MGVVSTWMKPIRHRFAANVAKWLIWVDGLMRPSKSPTKVVRERANRKSTNPEEPATIGQDDAAKRWKPGPTQLSAANRAGSAAYMLESRKSDAKLPDHARTADQGIEKRLGIIGMTCSG